MVSQIIFTVCLVCQSVHHFFRLVKILLNLTSLTSTIIEVYNRNTLTGRIFLHLHNYIMRMLFQLLPNFQLKVRHRWYFENS